MFFCLNRLKQATAQGQRNGAPTVVGKQNDSVIGEKKLINSQCVSLGAMLL
jgi:hypothetical protein